MSISRRFFRSLKFFRAQIRFAVILLALAGAAGVSHATTITVASGGDFQAALYAAQPGDTIILEAGATFAGPFDLPTKAGADFINVRSSRLAELPAGQRVTIAQRGLMPRITGPRYSYAIRAVQGAHHYRFEGIEFTTATRTDYTYHLIQLGGWGADQDTLEEVPHHLIIDRSLVYIEDEEQESIRGVLLNSASTDITNSHLSGWKSRGFDTQAAGGFNGPGPFRLINNYFEASGECVMFGGDDPSIPNLVHSDIEIRRNHFGKPIRWRSKGWANKNLFELKNARRVIIDGNLFENNWGHAQTGEAILFTPRNSGTAPWSVVEDVQFTNNVVRHAGAGINILGEDYFHPSQQTKRINISNNLFEDIDGGTWNGRGEFLLMTRPAADITVDHNTIVHSGNLVSVGEGPHTGFRFTNNLARHNEYGIFGDNVGSGTAAITQYFPGGVVRGNVIAGADANRYPVDNFYPWQWSEVGFVDAGVGDYRLAAGSPYRGRATDGKDIGCDFDALNAALGGSVPPTPTPSPTPTPFPTPTSTPTPTPTPVPTPTPQTGPRVRKAKTRGQNLSNQLSSFGGTPSSAAQMNLASNDALGLFISEVQEAQGQFNSEREIYPAATKIEVELVTALRFALQAQVSSLARDLPGFRFHLREAISHLELSDVLITHGNIANPIDVASYVVRQHYVDFLDREPEQAGNDFWVGQLNACGTDAQCFVDRRIHVSAAFFLSIEFRQTGYFVHRLYKTSYGRVPSIVEFIPDNAVMGRGVIVGTSDWETRLAANKDQFLHSWVQRADFNSRYAYLTNGQYVDALIANLGVTIDPKERDALILDLANGASRANVLGRIAQNEVFSRSELNSAFVLMQYFGYLTRDPDGAGFNFWLNKLNQFDGNYQRAEMVKAFLASQEYRTRFAL